MEKRVLQIPATQAAGELFAPSAAVNLAMGYKSKITVTVGEMPANAKSLMGMLMLATAQGDTITVTAEGSDEKEAVDCLCNCISAGLSDVQARA